MSESASAPAASDDVPPGYQVLVRRSNSFIGLIGPLYTKKLETGRVLLALRVAEKHLNIQGVAHGGMLSTLADSALGMNIALARSVRTGQVTVSLTMDFLSGARLGDWLEAHVTLTRMGQRLAYANCDLRVGERHVLRSSAVFAFVDRPLPEALRISLDQAASDG